MDGVLVIDKPSGPTSAAVVARVKRALSIKKVGHTGTLDPMATGVLPLCLGRATRIAQWLLADDKAYEGELVLGVETDTLDAEGQVVATDEAGAAAVDEAALRAAFDRWVGEVEQRPPMFSALKKDGVRLHQLARRGVEVERPARPIRVDTFELRGFADRRARFFVACSKGTYVRSLVADVGAALGCGAHLTMLRRTRAGRFSIDDAVELAVVEQGRAAVADRLIRPADALDHLPAVVVAGERAAQVANGLNLRWDQISNDDELLGLFRLVDAHGALQAIAHLERGQLVYDRVIPS